MTAPGNPLLERTSPPWVLEALRALLALALGLRLAPLPALGPCRAGIALLYALLFWLLWGWVQQNYERWFQDLQREGVGLETPAAPSRWFGFQANLPGQDRLGWMHACAFLGSAAPLALLLRSWEVMLGAVVLWVLTVYVVSQRIVLRLYPLLTEARDAALRTRLAPHFFFNVLNTLQAQIPVDPIGAQETAERLGRFYRLVLERAALRTVPLRDELAFVELYLGLARLRLGDRLKVQIEIPEELEDCPVPPLALQVLVENAVQHGLAPLEAGGLITLGARQEGADLVVWVEDPGPGISSRKGTGTALETLRRRLLRRDDLQLGFHEGRHRASFRWPATGMTLAD